MKKTFKKIVYVYKVFYWFVWYNLLNGEAAKVWHLLKIMAKHYVIGTPYAAIIETSNTCNFRCPTCPTPHKLIHARRPPEMMSLEKFKKIVDNIKDDVHIVYLYNSNEPLLHPDIVEMIKYASSQNLHTMISSNCSLLTEDMSARLLDSGLGEIRFALDGLTKESFETFRRGGDYAVVRKNIEYFCELKHKLGRKRPIATLQFILNKLNQDQVQDIKKFAHDNYVDKLYIKPFIMSPYAYTPEEIESLSKQFFADKDINDEYIVYKQGEHGLDPKVNYRKCHDVKRVFTILSGGQAVMCCFDLYGDYSYGQMDETKLSDLWFSDKSKTIRKFAFRRKPPLCKVCGNVE